MVKCTLMLSKKNCHCHSAINATHAKKLGILTERLESGMALEKHDFPPESSNVDTDVLNFTFSVNYSGAFQRFGRTQTSCACFHFFSRCSTLQMVASLVCCVAEIWQHVTVLWTRIT